MTLSSQLLNAIPARSFDLPVCKYSYRMNEYFGFTTTFIIFCQIHYTSVVLLNESKEMNGTYQRSRNTAIVTQIERMMNILTIDSL